MANSGATIVISIKNPTRSDYSYQATVGLQSSISQLKGKIQQEYVGNPEPQRQRLIFQGKILTNDSTIASILHQHDQQITPTFHLVVSPDDNAAQTQSTAPTPTQPHQQVPLNTNQHQQPQFQQSFFQAQHPNMQHMDPQMARYYQLLQQQTLAMAYQQQQQLQQQQQQQQQQRAIPQPQFNANNQQHYHQNAQPEQIQPQPQPAAQGENFGLLLKLAIFVFILSQGADTKVIVLFSIAALIIYLYLTGRFGIRIRTVSPAPQPPVAPQEPPSGIFGELYDSMILLFVSLIPAWSPPQRIAPAQNIPDIDDSTIATDVNNNNNNGNDNGNDNAEE